LTEEYEAGWKITDAMPVNVLGFQTHRDHFAVAFEKSEIERRILSLRGMPGDEEIREQFALTDNRDWKLTDARNQLRETGDWQKPIIRCLYRPFDFRYCYFSTVAMDYPRRELIDHVVWHENLCLGVGRQGLAVNDPEWYLISIAKEPIDANVFSLDYA
jgi:hypothetical protein